MTCMLCPPDPGGLNHYVLTTNVGLLWMSIAIWTIIIIVIIIVIITIIIIIIMVVIYI